MKRGSIEEAASRLRRGDRIHRAYPGSVAAYGEGAPEAAEYSDADLRRSGDGDGGEGDRADVLSAYRRMLGGRGVPDDEANAASARIKMSGVARPEGGRLRLRNRIYRRTFDHRWVLENLPNQELRRERKAFWKGAFRASLVAAIFCGLSALVVFFGKIAASVRERTEDTDSIQNDLDWLRGLDERRRDHRMGVPLGGGLKVLSPGWEMAYWRRATGAFGSAIDTGASIEGVALRDDSRTAACLSKGQIGLVDLVAKRFVGKALNDGRLTQGQWLHRAVQLLIWNDGGRSIELRSATSGRAVRARSFGTRILVGGIAADDHWALLWNAGTMARLDLSNFGTSPLPFRVEAPQRLTLSPDGARVVVSDLDAEGQRTRVVDLATGRVLLTVEEQVVEGANRPCGAAFVSGSSRLLLGRLDGSASLYDLASGRTLGSVRLSAEGPIVGLSVDRAGRRAVAVDGHRQSFLMDLGAGGPTLRSRFDDARQAALLPDGSTVITVADALRIRPIDAAGPTLERDLHRAVDGPVFSSEGSATIAAAGGLESWDLFHLDRPPVRIALPGTLLPDETGGLWSIATSSGVRIVDRHGKGVGTLLPSSGEMEAFVVDPARKRLFRIRSKTVFALDLANGRVERRWTFDEPLADLCLSPDGSKLVVRGRSGSLAAFDARSGAPLWRTERKELEATTLRFSPDGRWLAVGQFFRVVAIVDAATGAIGNSCPQTGPPSALAWTSSGDRLFVGAEDGTIQSVGRVVSPRSFDSQVQDPAWTELGVIGRHSRPIADLTLLPGDRTLASVDRGGSIKLWTTSDRL